MKDILAKILLKKRGPAWNTSVFYLLLGGTFLNWLASQEGSCDNLSVLKQFLHNGSSAPDNEPHPFLDSAPTLPVKNTHKKTKKQNKSKQTNKKTLTCHKETKEPRNMAVQHLSSLKNLLTLLYFCFCFPLEMKLRP